MIDFFVYFFIIISFFCLYSYYFEKLIKKNKKKYIYNNSLDALAKTNSLEIKTRRKSLGSPRKKYK
jgi:hypothetical protein